MKTADDIINELMDRNNAYVSNEKLQNPSITSPETRLNIARNAQKPMAAIIACSDSRVTPEILFSAGLGELFTIRNAGNVVTEKSVLGSLQYAIDHLKVPVVVLMGHSGCGAINAALGVAKGNGNQSNTPLSDYVTELSEVVKHNVGSSDDTREAVVTNIQYGVNFLKTERTPIRSAYESNSIDIIGAFYDMFSGKVYFMDP